MASIGLEPLTEDALRAIVASPDAFAASHGLSLGPHGELLRETARQSLAFRLKENLFEPWAGYLAVDPATSTIVGTCSFTGPPSAEGAVEIAYTTFPAHEGRGHATAMARGLLLRATESPAVRVVRAHTLPEPNASTRILERVGFVRAGEADDSDAGRVWRWEWRR